MTIQENVVKTQELVGAVAQDYRMALESGDDAIIVSLRRVAGKVKLAYDIASRIKKNPAKYLDAEKVLSGPKMSASATDEGILAHLALERSAERRLGACNALDRVIKSIAK